MCLDILIFYFLSLYFILISATYKDYDVTTIYRMTNEFKETYENGNYLFIYVIFLSFKNM